MIFNDHCYVVLSTDFSELSTITRKPNWMHLKSLSLTLRNVHRFSTPPCVLDNRAHGIIHRGCTNDSTTERQEKIYKELFKKAEDIPGRLFRHNIPPIRSFSMHDSTPLRILSPLATFLRNTEKQGHFEFFINL